MSAATLALCASALGFASQASATEPPVTGAADNLRTGWYPEQASLTPSLVSGGKFRQVFKRALHGRVLAQPLVADHTLLIATEEDWIYGLDPGSGAVLWERQVGTPVNQPTSECADIPGHMGVTSTPVINPETGIAYFTSNQYVTEGATTRNVWFMRAIELTNGKEVPGFPVEIKGHAENFTRNIEFEPTQELQRPALLLMNGVVYAAFGSHCDLYPYEGWLVGVSTSHQLKDMWASAEVAGSIWQAGSGLISDGPGQIVFSTGNGPGSGPSQDPPKGKGSEPHEEDGFGESVVRVQVQGNGSLKASDFFSPYDNTVMDTTDLDLGSSGPIELPAPYFGTTKDPHLIVQSGKQGLVYLLNAESLGGMGQGTSEKDSVLQQLGPYGGVWDGSAAWPGEGGYVYIPTVEFGENHHLLAFKYGTNGSEEPMLTLAGSSEEETKFGSGAPIVTSNGTEHGSAVVWDTSCHSEVPCEGAQLLARAAAPTSEEVLPTLFRAPIGTGSKFARPLASGGRIYVANGEGDVYGFGTLSLSASSASLPFGSVTAGGSVSREVTFTNNGASPLKIAELKEPLGPFQVTGLPAAGEAIEAHQTVTAHVTFAPSAAGGFDATLGVVTEAGEADVALSGSASAAPSPPQQEQPTIAPANIPAVGMAEEPEATPATSLVSTSLRAGPAGRLDMSLRCPADEKSCSGNVTLTTLNGKGAALGHRSRRHAAVTLASGSFSIAGGHVAKVVLHLTARGRALLAHHRFLPALATIVVRNAVGVTRTQTLRVTVLPPAKRAPRRR